MTPNISQRHRSHGTRYQKKSLYLRSANEYVVGWYGTSDLPSARYRQPAQVDIDREEAFQFLNKEIAVYIDAHTVEDMDLGYIGRYLYRAWLHLHKGRPPFQRGGFLAKPLRISRKHTASLDALSSFHRDLTSTLSVHLDDLVHFEQGRDHSTFASQSVNPSVQTLKNHGYLMRPLFCAIYMVVDNQSLAGYTNPPRVPERVNGDWMALRSQFRANQVSGHTVLLVKTGDDSHLSTPISFLPLFDAGLALNVNREDYQDGEESEVVRVKIDDAISFIWDLTTKEMNCNKDNLDLAESLRQEQDMHRKAWVSKVVEHAQEVGIDTNGYSWQAIRRALARANNEAFDEDQVDPYWETMIWTILALQQIPSSISTLQIFAMIFTSRYDIPIPDVDLLTYIFDLWSEESQQASSDKPVYVEAHDSTKQLNKAQLKHMVESIAAGLRHTFKVRDGDVILGFCENSILYPAVILASIASGGVFTGANPTYTYSELVNQLTVSGAKCIVTDSPRLEMAEKAAKAAGLPPNSLVLIDSKGSSSVHGVSSFQSLLGHGTYSWERISDPKVLANKLAVLNFSSGTTGLPKACEITHRNLVANAEQNLHLDRVARKRKNDPTFAANDVHCAFLPFYHAMGLITFCILNVKRCCTTVVMPKFDLKSFLSTIQKFKVTYLIFAPPVVSMLVKSPLVSQYDLSSVKFLVCGAAPLQADVEKRLEALFSKTGARSRQGWGMSEATMSISIFGPDEFDPSHGSVGYLVANMQLQIIDENGKAVGYDEEGEAILAGPNVFKGYYKNPAATKETFTDDGWLKTGDIVKVDKTGLITIVDRKKELIKVKGFQVAPSELEGHLLEHDGVQDCAVIRVLRDGHEHPQAHIVRKKPDATAESILSFMDKRLSPIKRITGGIVFTDAIPKSPSGKILRRLIKDGFASKDPSPRL
ncbi:4-coumarate ligase [Fusarium tjaetaba]|uniref:4-coumarate ligase n=1 Tax=Fusarium tjaetaba TaxID=1567544 RepID=A0A8H5W2D2_9HYPO|nr:4-coumarate ligase [Fusarium tjaetaba]KAF5643025.1 4-coumarate ligase [Fusarium tjaetaba]